MCTLAHLSCLLSSTSLAFEPVLHPHALTFPPHTTVFYLSCLGLCSPFFRNAASQIGLEKSYSPSAHITPLARVERLASSLVQSVQSPNHVHTELCAKPLLSEMPVLLDCKVPKVMGWLLCVSCHHVISTQNDAAKWL